MSLPPLPDYIPADGVLDSVAARGRLLSASPSLVLGPDGQPRQFLRSLTIDGVPYDLIGDTYWRRDTGTARYAAACRDARAFDANWPEGVKA